ncbi:MAG TPA: response regulator transcription factor [Nocardioides sp.]|uniref:response regulator transcription factor n=1 Tax=Nocardioides sp. TaxID=35761 RepID=UPI002BC1AE92|nr:response regulator transcription factor [Nocardioides sp.]HTW16024.1 response regulator transcription factor [Nocardioides sp.]
MTAALRVLVVDDHPVFRLGMTAILEEVAGVTVVGDAAGAAEAVERTVDLEPDVVVMDLDLAGESGVDATREILARRPGTAVLVVTGMDDDESLFAAIRAGARGYLVKGADPDEVERALWSVGRGAVVLGPQVAVRAVDYLTSARQARGGVFADLTVRERDVLELLARGHDNATIARRLVLTSKTVRNYVYAVLSKVGAPDRAALVVLAREAGIGVSVPERGPAG